MNLISVSANLCALAGAILLAFSGRDRLKPRTPKQVRTDVKNKRLIRDVTRVRYGRIWLGLGLIAISLLLPHLVKIGWISGGHIMLDSSTPAILSGILLLVLLCHKAPGRDPLAPQAGQQGSSCTRARAQSCRCVAIDTGLCLSGRTGGAPRAETFG